MSLKEHNMYNFSVVSIHMDIFLTMRQQSLIIDIFDPSAVVQS
jgi:hypothetical protein